MNTVAIKLAETRRSKVVNLLKENPSKIFSIKDVSDGLSINYATAKDDLKKLFASKPEIDHIPGQGYKYNMKTVKKLHNSEGYLDTTAELAIAKVDSKNEPRFKAGEVWGVTSHGGYEDFYIVLAPSYSDTTACLQLFDSKDTYIQTCGAALYMSKVEIFGKSYTIDSSKIVQKPNKYFTEKLGGLPGSVIASIKNKIAEALDIDISSDPVEVEKIVEKKVEVPVEVEKIVYKNDPDIELKMALLKQKVEIYERLVFGRGMNL